MSRTNLQRGLAKRTQVLVVAPHPDDETLGCGGSVLKHVADGHHVIVAFMTSGDAGGRRPKAELAKVREGEARAACRKLGVREVKFLRLPDGGLEATPHTMALGVSLIRAVRPDVLYLPHAQDGSRDHGQTHLAMIEAIRRADGESFQECPGAPWRVSLVLGYETWTPIAQPSYIEDVTKWMTRKLAALACHRSQIRATRYDEAIQGLNRYRGAMTGQGRFCECFEVWRMPPLMTAADR